VVLSTTAVIAVAGCNHSPPFPTGPFVGDGSFDGIVPVRLTFSTPVDGWPSYSADGRWISYRFARGSGDRDYCAGLLPAEGGQRFEEICAWELGEGSRSDDFRSLVLFGDDRMAFTRHASGTGNASPSEAGLYVGPLSREREAVKVLDLFARPNGASDTWSYLIDPVWVGGDELLVLASKAFIGQTVPFGPIDTVYQGVEIARIDVGTTPATITPVVAAPDAVAWTLDQASGMIHFHRRYYSAPPGSGALTVSADTVFRVPAAGGTAEAVYGRASTSGGSPLRLDGFAIVGGRLYVTQSYDVEHPSDPSCLIETFTNLWRVEAGTLEHVTASSSCNGSRWLRLSGSPTDEHLVAERILAGQRDLYRFDIAP
jgi:hypothetical protein